MGMTEDLFTNRPIDRDLDYSRPLDVHRWSSYPEVNELVHKVFALCFEGRPLKITTKHLKMVLLDLYVAWKEDPDLKIAVSLNSNSYRGKTRYNALHITRKTIDIVKELHRSGLIHFAKGFLDRNTRTGRLSRIWATQRLIDLFDSFHLSADMIKRSENEEVIILRDGDGKLIDYEDTAEVERMRSLVKKYNALLWTKFIDIRRLDKPRIRKSDGTYLSIGVHSQRVRRVFNRGALDKGGRFFGAWWQGCPKEWRKEIFIDDAPIIEEDYSSLYIALLYAQKGVNYYNSKKEDAYQLKIPLFLSTLEQTRHYAKLLLLMAVNAKSDKAAFAAFREDRKQDGDILGSKLKDAQLEEMLEGLRKKHPEIADRLGSDAGIDLMNQDSKITEKVISTFVNANKPVLTVHDSYIVHFGDWKLLQATLEEAYEEVTGMQGIRSTRTGVAMGDENSWLKERLAPEALLRSKGYAQRLIDWMAYRKP